MNTTLSSLAPTSQQRLLACSAARLFVCMYVGATHKKRHARLTITIRLYVYIISLACTHIESAITIDAHVSTLYYVGQLHCTAMLFSRDSDMS